MKRIALTTLFLTSFTALSATPLANALPKRTTGEVGGGVVYHCSDRSKTVSLTLDLLSKAGEKSAVFSEVGFKEVYFEKQNGKLKHEFIANKVDLFELRRDTVLFEMRRVSDRRSVLSLEIEPSSIQAAHAYEHEGMQVVKFNGFLRSNPLELNREPVSCLQTSWQ